MVGREDMQEPAITVMERCDLLGNISEEDGALTRPFGSRAMREVNQIVSGWMEDAGMTVRRDAMRNLIGRYEGEGEETLLLGSHLDTVRDAGKYDGQLGVLVALACVRRLHDRGERPPFSIEIPCFADEEGLRFGTTFLGSSVYAGAFDRELLKLEDPAGISLGDAVRDFGGSPEELGTDGRDSGGLIGYCELHIEQGPVLEREGLPVGVVTGIQGQSRMRIRFSGEAGHAGTVPMAGRRDALCAASEFVLEVEEAGKAQPGAVATVGELSVLPGAVNVIPGEVELSLDLRHAEDSVRESLRDHFESRAREIAYSRGCEVSWQVRQETPAVPSEPGLSGILGRAIEESGVSLRPLPSGAGHDAAQMAEIAPVTMLFLRCKEGISHNPAESVTREDVGTAIQVMGRFIELLGEARSARADEAR